MKELTKEHIFTFEVKYKSNKMIRILRDVGGNAKTELTPHLLNRVIAPKLPKIFNYDKDKIFEFLDDYKDVIDWNNVSQHRYFSICNKAVFEEFIVRFKPYITDRFF